MILLSSQFLTLRHKVIELAWIQAIAYINVLSWDLRYASPPQKRFTSVILPVTDECFSYPSGIYGGRKMIDNHKLRSFCFFLIFSLLYILKKNDQFRHLERTNKNIKEGWTQSMWSIKNYISSCDYLQNFLVIWKKIYENKLYPCGHIHGTMWLNLKYFCRLRR